MNYLLGLVRVKAVAMLIGPAGVGLVSIYTSALGLLGSVTAVGVPNSGVREIASALAKVNLKQAQVAATAVRRVSWLAGVLGWVLLSVAFVPFSNVIHDSPFQPLALIALGGALLFNNLAVGYAAVLQGAQRMGDIARVNVLSVAASTIITVVLYAWLGSAGILPVLVSTALISFACTWGFTRRIELLNGSSSWAETFICAKRLLKFGSAFAWSALLAAGLDMAIRAIVAREHGIEASGLYQAAWAISGLFASFILAAMGTDYYPRLTSVIADHEAAARTVNEQSELGMLLALPGMLLLLAFARPIMTALYSEAFVESAKLLPWFTLGVFARVISWPMGYVLIALGSARWFAATQTVYLTGHLLLVVILVPRFGTLGTAYAFLAVYASHAVGMFLLSRKLIGFRWTPATLKVFLTSAFFVAGAVLTEMLLDGVPGVSVGILFFLGGGIYAGRELMVRAYGYSFSELTEKLLRRWRRAPEQHTKS